METKRTFLSAFVLIIFFLITSPAFTEPVAGMQGVQHYDVNGDGKADILWRHESGVVVAWFLSGTTLLSTSVLGGVADVNWQIQGLGDVDGNGEADVLWHNLDTGAVAIWVMSGGAIAGVGFPGVVPHGWEMQNHRRYLGIHTT
jgi:hypothetical protein